jgi:hypothetical protein
LYLRPRNIRVELVFLPSKIFALLCLDCKLVKRPDLQVQAFLICLVNPFSSALGSARQHRNIPGVSCIGTKAQHQVKVTGASALRQSKRVYQGISRPQRFDEDAYTLR